MKSKLTVTIGIPAYNEESNIGYLLESVLKQKGDNFVVEKIYVLCDGCTDQTVRVAENLAQKHKQIRVIDYHKREGKSVRLNNLYSLNNSDIVINFDADVLLSDQKVIQEVVRKFRNNVAMVSACNLPVEGESFVQKITRAGDLLWYEIRSKYNNGNNIYNSSGCSTALAKSFAKKFRYPTGTVADQQYIFHKVKESGKQFAFVDKVMVLYRSPDNLKEYFLQAHRSLNEKYPILEALGDELEIEYRIPMIYKITAIVKRVIRDPVFTPLSIFLAIWLRVLPPSEDRLNKNGMWRMVTSTKKAIN